MEIEELFKQAIKRLKKEDEIKLEEMLKKINLLDSKSKKLFLYELYLNFSTIYNKDQFENCKVYGHEFSGWKPIMVKEKIIGNRETGFQNILIEKIIYERTCVECGLKEESYENPNQKVKRPQK